MPLNASLPGWPFGCRLCGYSGTIPGSGLVGEAQAWERGTGLRGLRSCGEHTKSEIRASKRMHRMKSTWLFPLTLTFTLVEARSPGETSGSRAREIVDRVDRLLRGKSSFGIAEMSIVTRRWDRSKTLEMRSEGTDKVLIRVLKPKKEEGMTTLKVGSDMWHFLPKIDRTIRVPTSMMTASWMGSHFTNDDLVKESQLIRDYEIRISYEGMREGVDVYEFTLTPLPKAPVPLGQDRGTGSQERLDADLGKVLW